MNPLAATVRQAIVRYEMLVPGDRVAVAVSGGADSVALLLLLSELRSDLGATLCVAHFNHQLRGTDSDADEKFVATLACKRGLEFIADRGDVRAAAKDRGWNLEDAARRLRYGFFAEIVARGAATRVATAHTSDDQAETILARLVRGTGLTGLASIYPVRGTIIRPLLHVRREALRKYLTAVKQEWREDATNADTQRLRARVRQRLLPDLEHHFSRSIVNKLGELAGLARGDEVFWKALVEERYCGIVERSNNTSSVEAKDLLWPMGQHVRRCGEQNPFRAVTQRIIRRLYSDIATTGGELSRKHVEQIIHLAEEDSSGRRMELPGGVRIHKQFGRLVFAVGDELAGSQQKHAYAYDVQLPRCGSAAITVPEIGRRFHLKVIDWPLRERETTCEGVVLDAERLCAPLVLRNWKPGDAYCPFGRSSQLKVSRMLMAGRIDLGQRALWPILTSAGRVAWADRMPVAKEFSASEATRTGLWIVEDGG